MIGWNNLGFKSESQTMLIIKFLLNSKISASNITVVDASVGFFLCGCYVTHVVLSNYIPQITLCKVIVTSSFYGVWLLASPRIVGLQPLYSSQQYTCSTITLAYCDIVALLPLTFCIAWNHYKCLLWLAELYLAMTLQFTVLL